MTKKFFAALLAAALITASTPAGAVELLKNLRFGGQIDVQATSATNALDFATHADCTARNSDGTCATFDTGTGARNDRIGDAQTRVMLHLDWDLLDDVHARVTMRKSDRNYGTIGGNENSNDNSQSLTQTTGDDVLGSVFLDEAFFKVDKIAGQLDLTMGRQFYGDSGDLIVYYGPSDKAWYGLPVFSLDAARADWNSEWLAVTGIAGKLTGHQIGAVPQADVDLRGINLAFKGNENFRGSLYGWNKLTHNTGALGAPPCTTASPPCPDGFAGGKNDNLYVIGLKSRLAGGGFWLKGEYAQDLGVSRRDTSIASVPDPTAAPASNYIGWAVLGDAGFKAESDNLGTFGVWGNVGLGSGRQNTREAHDDGFHAINSDYRPGSIYGRFASVPGVLTGLGNGVPTDGVNSPESAPGLSNRLIWGAGVKASPGFANRLGVGVSWWDFRVHRFTRIPNAQDPYLGNRHIGSELDVDLTWTHSENVAFGAGWGTFQPGGLIFEAVKADNIATPPAGRRGVNPVNLAYFDVRVKF